MDFPIATHSKARADWLKTRQYQEQTGGRYTPLGHVAELHSLADSIPLRLLKWGLKCFGLWNKGHRNAQDIIERQETFMSSRLPSSFDGYRILHITDLHLDELAIIGEKIISHIENLEYDLCILTGDYWDWRAGQDQTLITTLGNLINAAGAQDGVFAILGNHDAHWMVDLLEANDVKVLLNESVHIKRGDHQIKLTGVDDVNRFYTSSALDALTTNDHGFSVALVHSSEMANEAAANFYDMYLCGHSHGGQICFPGGRPLVTRLHRNKELFAGRWNIGGMQGLTSNGAGVSGQPIRFNTRGEYTLITLRSTV